MPLTPEFLALAKHSLSLDNRVRHFVSAKLSRLTNWHSDSSSQEYVYKAQACDYTLFHEWTKLA